MKRFVKICVILSLVTCSRKKLDSYNAILERIEDFTVENTSKGIIYDKVMSVAIDLDDHIWIGSESGFAQFKNSQWQNYYLPLAWPKVTRDYDGSIWILAKNCIKRVVGDLIVDVKIDSGDFFYTSMTKDGTGRQWFATDGNGLYSFSNNIWQHYTTKNNLTSNFISSIAYDRNNETLWVGTNKGLARFKDDEWRQEFLIDESDSSERVIFRPDESVSGGTSFGFRIMKEKLLTPTSGVDSQFPIKSIKIDDKKTIWVLTQASNLWYRENGKWSRYLIVNDESLIHDFMVDSKNNTLYIAGRGLYRIRIKEKLVEHLLTTSIYAIANDQKGYLWIATQENGLIKLDPSSLEHINMLPEGGIPSNFIRDIFIDKKGNIFAATQGGLAAFDGNEWSTIDFGIPVFSLAEDRNSNLYILTSGGLKKLTGTDLTIIPSNFDFKYWNNAVMAIDSAGAVSIGDNQNCKGLCIYRDHNWRIYDKDSGLSSNSINAILVDGKNRKWIATDNGLVMMDGKKTKAYNFKDGLVGNNITSIEDDGKGNLWIGTTRGVSRFDGHRFVNTFNGQYITEIKKGRYGDIWFGVSNGQLWRSNIGTYPDESSFTRFSTKDNFFEVQTLAIDSQGNVWTGDAFSGIKKLTFTYVKIETLSGINKIEKEAKSIEPSSSEGEWTVLYHDVSRTNVAPNKNIKPPFVLDWKIGIGPMAYSELSRFTPILVNGRLFVADYGSVLWCIDAATGAKLWKSIFGSQNIYSTLPIIATDDQLIVQGNDNNLCFISQIDGRKIAELNISLADFIIKDNLIYGITDAGIVIIDRKNKRITQKLPSEKGLCISADKEYFAISNWGPIAVYRFKDNQKIWGDEEIGFGRGHIVIYKDLIIYVSKEIHCYDLKTGKKLWKTKLDCMSNSPPSVWAEKLYLQYSSDESSVIALCMDVRSGNFIWERKFEASGHTAFACSYFPPVICNGIVYVIATPALYALDAETANMIWHKDIADDIIAPMIIGQERLFVLSACNTYAFRALEPGEHQPSVRQAEIVEAPDNLLRQIEERIDTIKLTCSSTVTTWIDDFQRLAFKESRNSGEWLQCHRLMDSLASQDQIEIIILFIQKEAITKWAVGSTENVVETTLKGVLKKRQQFAEKILPRLLKCIDQKYNLTLKQKAILFLGYINDNRAVNLLEELLNDNSVTEEVIYSLSVQPNNKSYDILKKLLTDESKCRFWRSATQNIMLYKTDERLEYTLRKLLENDWSDSLTKNYAKKAIKRIEEKKFQ